MNDHAPCAECGALLALDQRYCLTCGARRPEARLPFVDVLAGADTQVVAFGAAGVVPHREPVLVGAEDRLRRAVPLLALLSVLLLAVLSGLLLGHWSSDGGAQAAAPIVPPQVITVAAAAAPAGAVAAAPTATTADDASAGSSSDGGSGSGSGSAAHKGATKPAPAAKKAVKDLSKLSGAAYQKKVDKLPKTFSVGGKAPPKDNKPAGGGSDVEEIG